MAGFSKIVFSRGRVKPCFFVTFNVIIRLIFPENFIKIPQVVQKIWRASSSTSPIFVNFPNFLTFPCYKQTNDVSIKQVMSAFQHTLNRLYIVIMSRTSFTVNLHSIVCLNVKDILARSRHHIWSSVLSVSELSDCEFAFRLLSLNKLSKNCIGSYWL